MSLRSLDGNLFCKMIINGAKSLHLRAEYVNTLNVFPVPDGDTGTNMNLTMTAGAEELKKHLSATSSIGEHAQALSKGLLMGARGNSGVILSQLFRGFAKSVQDLEVINAMQFAQALQMGMETAYQAVVKPVEGTILTVAKYAARHGVSVARQTDDLETVMKEVLNKAMEALAKTPDLLPILKQVGVVDSGGQGLVYIYEGFFETLRTCQTGEEIQFAAVEVEGETRAQTKINSEEIMFPYDMEFFIRLKNKHSFPEKRFERKLSENGDSIILIQEENIVKVHVHSREPGKVLSEALKYGELTQFNILNMKDQHQEIINESSDEEENYETEHGIIAVAAGEGIIEIFRSLGVNVILTGGQTMNPSTEDFVRAIQSIKARNVFILPNNSNIVLTAQQAQGLVKKEVVVIPSKNISQGMAAALVFSQQETKDELTQKMSDAIHSVQSGQITHAVRDTTIDGLEVKQGHYIGIHNTKLCVSAPDILQVCKDLLTVMLQENGDIVTVLVGEDADEQVTVELIKWIQLTYPSLEIEQHTGGQPVYYYFFSVE